MKFILERSKLFIFLILILMLVGVYTFLTLPKREIPETPVDVVMVSAILPGAEPAEIEKTVTDPLERSVKKINGIDSMESVSADSASIITIALEDGVDNEQTINQLQQEIQRSEGDLPEDIHTPEVNKLDQTFPLVSYMFTGDEENLKDMETSLADLSEEIESIEGIAGTTVKGFNEKQIIVTLDSEKLAEEQIQPNEVLTSLQKLNQIQVGQSAVPLEKVANINEVSKDVEDIVTFEGKQAISYTVFLQPKQDIPSIDELVDNKMNEYADQLPEEITVHTYESQADNVNSIFDSLYVSLLLAVIAVLIITTSGLTLFGSFAVALTVLASVLIGLIPIPYMG